MQFSLLRSGDAYRVYRVWRLQGLRFRVKGFFKGLFSVNTTCGLQKPTGGEQIRPLYALSLSGRKSAAKAEPQPSQTETCTWRKEWKILDTSMPRKKTLTCSILPGTDRSPVLDNPHAFSNSVNSKLCSHNPALTRPATSPSQVTGSCTLASFQYNM